MRFYCPLPLSVPMTLELPDTARQHAQVLRARLGELLTLFNGDGLNYSARLVDMQRHTARVQIENSAVAATESALSLHLAVVLSKGDRLDWSLQKATELGVQRISLLFSERCEVKLREQERLERKIQHWHHIVISACEQCGRTRIPTVDAPVAFPTFLQQQHATSTQKLLLSPTARLGLRSLTAPTSAGFTLLVGPEGGFSAQEEQAALQHDYRAIGLGPRILRTETAPLVCLSLLQAEFGDLCDGDPL